ncbi:MAG: DUF2877 domain-containing protein [Candidatus Limiplasma sp.]|nr:DUF2877 domain-containing protein [Candidatus Limiplasma sp.]
MKKACMGEARLTPAFHGTGERRGRVHSVFQQVVNLSFPLEGEERLVALCKPGLPLLPDSIVAPRGWLEELALPVGAPVLLSPEALWAHGHSLPLRHAREWDGYLAPFSGAPASRELLEMERRCPNGFDALPPSLRGRAEAALTGGGIQRWLGLGRGLTPSFDDACVGVMALCRGLGRPAPFALGEVSATTDVSARYLRLAQEGYFGWPLWNLIASLFRGSVAKAVRELLGVGASSGADMLHGVAVALKDMGI